MRVYYGWSKVNKIRKKEALSVIYENAEKIKEGYIGKFQDTVYVRKQTPEEEADGKTATRVLTEYSIFFDDKKINRSLEKILLVNNQADQNNVSKREREEIQDSLKKAFLLAHPDYREPDYREVTEQPEFPFEYD